MARGYGVAGMATSVAVMIFLLRMYLLSSAYAYRFSLQECRHSCRFPMGESCWSQAWLPKPILKFLARNRLYKRPCRLPQSQGIVPSATGTFQSDMRMPAYAYSDKLVPYKTRPTCFCVCGHMQGMSGMYRPWMAASARPARPMEYCLDCFACAFVYVFAYVVIRILNGLEHVGILR